MGRSIIYSFTIPDDEKELRAFLDAMPNRSEHIRRLLLDDMRLANEDILSKRFRQNDAGTSAEGIRKIKKHRK